MGKQKEENIQYTTFRNTCNITKPLSKHEENLEA